MQKELLKQMYLEYAEVANKQLRELTRFYEENKNYLTALTYDFIADEFIEITDIGTDGEGNVFANYYVSNCENSITFTLELTDNIGFNKEMSRMVKAMERRKEYLAIQQAKEMAKKESALAERKALYEKLRAEFE